MKNPADALPPEIARQIHPDWRKNEAAYWAVRDQLLVPWADCQVLQLSPFQGRPGWMGGIAGGTAPTLLFPVWVYLDGKEYPCRLQADFIGSERILGQDVLNRLETMFRGPAGEVIVNP